MINLLLTGAYKYKPEQIEALHTLGCNIHFLQQESDTLPLPAAEFDAIVCNGLFLYHPIDSFKNLRYIQLTSAGLDRIPLKEIHARGIILNNARGVYSVPMAEWAMFRVLEHYKAGWHFLTAQQKNIWSKHRGLQEISGCNVAIIGAGSVGQEVAKRFKAFGAQTVGFDIRTNSIPEFDMIEPIQLIESKINTFDIIVITAPLTESTYHLFSESMLSKLKENTTLVNIARGPLIDESALIRVLNNRQDIYAALDVFENEPLDIDSPLWLLPNVALSPHNSFVSNGNSRRLFSLIYCNLKNWIENID